MRELSLAKMVGVVFMFCAVTAIASPAQTFKTLLNFNNTNGAHPLYMSLAQGTDGNLYGTTQTGGTSSAQCNGCGTVFKITTGGTLTTLYSFCAQTSCTDGFYPIAGLVLGTDGNFYGTTQAGGAKGGYGTVFKITSGGTLTTLHSFDFSDGAYPYGGLVQATDGNLYGTTEGGGAGDGTVFKISQGGDSPRSTALPAVLMGASLTAVWCKPPTESSTEPLRTAGPSRITVRSSKSPPGAR